MKESGPAAQPHYVPLRATISVEDTGDMACDYGYLGGWECGMVWGGGQSHVDIHLSKPGQLYCPCRVSELERLNGSKINLHFYISGQMGVTCLVQADDDQGIRCDALRASWRSALSTDWRGFGKESVST